MKQFFASGVDYSYSILSSKVLLYYVMCVVRA